MFNLDDDLLILRPFQQFVVKFIGSWGSVLLIIFYVENLDVGSWGVKNDV